MRIIFKLIILCLLPVFSYGEGGRLISDIISGIEGYKEKTIVLDLRLKYHDRIFEKIIFYDSENVDIEFDISGKERRKLLADDLLNIHEGMTYRVTFRVIGSGSLGGLTGDLAGFKPLIIEKIPEGAPK